VLRDVIGIGKSLLLRDGNAGERQNQGGSDQ
jgi:hypothetical protein